MDAARSTGSIRVPVSSTQRDIERVFDGSILSLPLVPSFLAFVIALSSSVIYNITDIDTCSQYVQFFVLANIVWSYVFVWSYGFILVGPQMKEIIGTLLIYLIYFVLQLALMLYGSWVVWVEWRDATACYVGNTPLFWAALVGVATFWLSLVAFLLLFIVYGVKRCFRGGANLDMATLTDSRAEALAVQKQQLGVELATLAAADARRHELLERQAAVERDLAAERAAHSPPAQAAAVAVAAASGAQ